MKRINLTPDTEKSGEKTTLREHFKCQKVEVVPTKEKIKQEKKPTPKLTKFPKTPMKMPPKNQGDNFILFYYQSPQKRIFGWFGGDYEAKK